MSSTSPTEPTTATVAEAVPPGTGPERAPGHGGRITARWEPWLFSLPLVLFLSAFFLVPLFRMAILTVTPEDADGFSLSAYTTIFTDPFNREIVWRTLRLSFLSTLVTLVLAYPIAVWMRELSPRWRGVLVILLLSPLLTSVVVRTLGWVVLLAPQGVANDLLGAVGLGPFSFLYNDTAVVLGLTHVYLGYMVLSLLTTILRIPDNMVNAAANLGATRWQILRKVVWPMSLPGVLAGCVIVFSLTASAYVTPSLLGGSSSPLMATRVYQLGVVYLEWDHAAAFAVVLFLLVMGSVWAFTRLMESGKRRVIFR